MVKRESKDIFIRQNEDDMLDHLKAQRFVYSSAKKYAIAIFLCLTFSPLVINIIISYFVKCEELISLLFFVILILFGLGQFFRCKLKKDKFLAACIQQKFDIYVFNMQEILQKDIKFKTHLKESISNAVRKYKNNGENNFRDWYPKKYSNLPYEQAVFYCQKVNFNWTLKLKHKYCFTLIVFLIITTIIIIINAIMNCSSVNNLILISVTLLPLVSNFSDSYQKLTKDIQILEEILEKIEQTEMEFGSLNNEKLREITEELQEKIFLYRQKAYLIPNWFYKFHKKNFQITEDDSAKEISNQYKPKTKGKNYGKI